MTDSDSRTDLSGRFYAWRFLVMTLVVLLLGLVASYLVLPRLVKGRVIEFVQAQTGVAPTIEKVSFDPFRLRLSIAGFQLDDPESAASILSLDELVVDIRLKGFLDADLVLEELVLVGPRVVMELSEDGKLNWARLLPQGDAEASADGAESAEDDSLLLVDIESLRIVDGEFAFRDRSQTPIFEVEASPIRLEVRDWTTRVGRASPVSLAIMLGEATKLDWQGTVGLDPLNVKGRIEWAGFDLENVSMYLPDSIQLALSRGVASGAFDISVSRTEGDSEMKVSAEGRAQVDDLQALDRDGGAEFLAWERLRFEGVQISPQALNVAVIGLTKAEMKVSLDSKGASNLSRIFEGGESGEEGSPTAEQREDRVEEESLSIAIGRVELDQLRVEFLDQSVAPDFQISVDSISGTIEGLSTDPSARAKLDLGGKVDSIAPLKLAGSINPFSEQALTDLSLTLSGMSMPNLSPYSGRYVGYAIDRGKLDLNLTYRISGGALDAENRIVLDQFEFGEKVEGETATSLPVPLAVALMRDGKGQISVDLPIHGQLDDPSFSVFGLLGDALLSLVGKVVTSPFAVAGKLLGGSSEDLSSVQFAPGSDGLTEKELGEISAVASAILDQPNLRLEIRGRANLGRDGPVIGGARGSADEAALRALAKARAASVQKALVEQFGVAAGRVFLVDVEIGEVDGLDDEGTMATEISLSVE